MTQQTTYLLTVVVSQTRGHWHRWKKWDWITLLSQFRFGVWWNAFFQDGEWNSGVYAAAVWPQLETTAQRRPHPHHGELWSCLFLSSTSHHWSRPHLALGLPNCQQAGSTVALTVVSLVLSSFCRQRPAPFSLLVPKWVASGNESSPWRLRPVR